MKPASLAILFLISSFGTANASFGADGATNFADSLWTVGTEAYTAGRFEQARDAWLSLYSAGLSSPELCTNIGNAYYKSDDNAHAILYYERALKLDPSYGDARHNLKFAQSRNRDRIDVVPNSFGKYDSEFGMEDGFQFLGGTFYNIVCRLSRHASALSIGKKRLRVRPVSLSELCCFTICRGFGLRFMAEERLHEGR